MNFYQTSFYRWAFVIVLVVYSITAWDSHGYYHADEHFQIIEFANYKLGNVPKHEMPWEWQEKMRPASQPGIAYIVMYTANLMGIVNPYLVAFLLRLLSMILMLSCTLFFVKSSIHLINENYRFAYFLASFLLWFMPVSYVRFSSENWSSAFILLALSFLISKTRVNRFNPTIIGSMIGLAFLFRYQSAIMGLGILAWLIFIQRDSILKIAQIIISGLMIIALGVLIDIWYYEEYVFAPWEYFNQNIVYGKVNSFGAEKWNYYITEIAEYSGKPIGYFFLLALAILLIKKPKSLFLWITIPVIVIHSFIQHKEIRFLFVFINLIPIILFLAWQELPRININRYIKLFLRFVIAGLIMINIAGLIAMMSKSAGMAQVGITKYIYDNYSGRKINIVHTTWSQPYNTFGGQSARFYFKNDVDLSQINSLCSLTENYIRDDMVNFLVLRKHDIKRDTCLSRLKNFNLELEVTSVPDWIVSFDNYYGKLKDDDILMMYRFRKK